MGMWTSVRGGESISKITGNILAYSALFGLVSCLEKVGQTLL